MPAANSDTPPTASVTPPKPRSKSPKKKRLKPKSSDGSPSKIGPSQSIPGATLEPDLQDGGPQGIPPKTLELFSQIVFNSTTKQFVEAIQSALKNYVFIHWMIFAMSLLVNSAIPLKSSPRISSYYAALIWFD